jgi:hypothetical protein
MVFIPVPKFIVFNPEQEKKASSPKDVTLLGIVTEVSDLLTAKQ